MDIEKSDNASNSTQIIPVSIEDETRTSYLNYAVFVITYRALPNVKDGLKPVLRRIFVALNGMGLTQDKPFKKMVRIVGEVMGKYHPYGDSSIYLSLVRLAQFWSMRYPLIDPQGNMGSIDGDEPAAMRYTEGRLKKITEEGLLADLSEEVVQYHPNFDNSLKEPEALTGPLPNLIVNGSIGIAVGMATKMAPHNLREATNAIVAYIDDPDITTTALMEHITAPDFPTGGIIYGLKGVRDAFETGRGRIVVRGKATIEPLGSGRQQIIVTEVPYMVNKSVMIERTAQLIQNETIKGISELRDESDKEGIRIVYELKKDAIAHVVLNTLYKFTELQSTFSVNNVALVDGTPKLLNIKELIHYYVVHRHDVINRRTEAQQRKALYQKHLLEGYLLVADNINEVVEIIKKSKDAQEAKQALDKQYNLSEIQTKAILEMRLQRLTGLERQKIVQQHKDTEALLVHLAAILADKNKRMEIVKEELQHLSKRYGDERRTRVEADTADLGIEDLIPNQRMVITLSKQGYIKTTPLKTYRLQHRGGVGAKGVGTKKEDFLDQLFVASAHDYLLIFTASGKVFSQKVYGLPQGGKNAQGRAIQNILEIAPNDTICSILRVEKLNDEDFIEGKYVTFATARGVVKKVALSAFKRPMRRGIRAITFKENDKLIGVKLTEKEHYIILGLSSGKAIRFNQAAVRPMGRTAAGVRGITLASPEDKVIGMISTPEKEATTILVLAEKGYGKRSKIKDYRITNRGGKGIKTIQITNKTGKLIAIKAVTKEDELMIMNASGITLRTPVAAMRTMSRSTQGVRMLRLRNQDSIASMAIIRNIDNTTIQV